LPEGFKHMTQITISLASASEPCHTTNDRSVKQVQQFYVSAVQQPGQ
jgi:hypothetical protein